MMIQAFFPARRRLRILATILAAGPCLAVAGTLAAANKTESSNDAERLVQEALHREIYGLSDERQQLLDQAAEIDPQYAPAQWHRGRVRYANRWVAADAVPALAAQDRRLVAYALRREETPPTVDGQLALASWCRKQDLVPQERAHLAQVLELNPDHADARNRMGFRRVDGRWISETQIRESNEQLRAELQALTAWRPKITQLRDDLSSRSQNERQLAESVIRSISDPEAIPALEFVLSRHSEDAARMVLDALENMSDQRAALSLSRHAVMSAWPEIRQAAARALSKRPYDHFVPAMLSSMFTPVSSHVTIGAGPRGSVVYRHSFLREGQDQNQLLVLDTEYRRISRPGGDRDETAARTMNSAARDALTREMGVARQNLTSTLVNDNVTRALTLATGQQIGSTPQAWWNWWHQENEVYVNQQKPTQTVRQSRQIAMVDQSTGGRQTGGGGGITGGGRQGGMDCLAAGTLVWTAGGPQRIETLQPGDLVLSQSPDTGELTYQPVLSTTVRPAGPLVQVQAGTETFETSGGHLFWVAGDGWVKARLLKSGTVLHGQLGTVPVRAVDAGREAETYNLIVQGFHTYFVGEGKVLCHDNTVRRVTRCAVPGLAD